MYPLRNLSRSFKINDNPFYFIIIYISLEMKKSIDSETKPFEVEIPTDPKTKTNSWFKSDSILVRLIEIVIFIFIFISMQK